MTMISKKGQQKIMSQKETTKNKNEKNKEQWVITDRKKWQQVTTINDA